MATVYARTLAAGTAQATVNLHLGAPRAGTVVTASGGVLLRAPYFFLAVQGAGLSVHALRRGGHLFVELPAAARPEYDGKPWAEFDLSGPGTSAAAEAGSALLFMDPGPALGALRMPATKIVLVGAHPVSDQPLTEYRLDYPTSELVAPGPGGAPRAGLVSLLAQMANPRPDLMAVRVWVDSQGRLVELAMSVTLETEPVRPSAAQAAFANQLPTIVSVNVYLGQFGRRVDVAAPPKASTVAVPASQLEGGAL
jgi:hypothetical protein